MSQDMIVSILPGAQPGSAWRQLHPQLALAMRLLIFAVGGITAYAVSLCDMSGSFVICNLCCFMICSPVCSMCNEYAACGGLLHPSLPKPISLYDHCFGSASDLCTPGLCTPCLLGEWNAPCTFLHHNKLDLCLTVHLPFTDLLRLV